MIEKRFGDAASSFEVSMDTAERRTVLEQTCDLKNFTIDPE